jgi:hypothetical protein
MTNVITPSFITRSLKVLAEISHKDGLFSPSFFVFLHLCHSIRSMYALSLNILGDIAALVKLKKRIRRFAFDGLIVYI